MKNAFPQILIFTFVCLILSACKKDRLSAEKDILIGTWNWQHTDFSHYCDGWLVHETYDPTSENETYEIEFLKKGVIQFYKNDVLVSEHFIKFNTASIQKEGIVESHKEISFDIFLDGNAETNITGKGTQNEMIISSYPFVLELECHYWIRNYFKKRY